MSSSCYNFFIHFVKFCRLMNILRTTSSKTSIPLFVIRNVQLTLQLAMEKLTAETNKENFQHKETKIAFPCCFILTWSSISLFTDLNFSAPNFQRSVDKQNQLGARENVHLISGITSTVFTLFQLRSTSKYSDNLIEERIYW